MIVIIINMLCDNEFEMFLIFVSDFMIFFYKIIENITFLIINY